MPVKKQDPILVVIEFLEKYPALYKTQKRKDIPDPRTKAGKLKIKKIMEDALLKKIIPSTPETIPDPLVSIILEAFHGIKKNKLTNIAKEHQLSMSAENVVGALLEHYINSESKHYGWCICAGSVVNGTDFLRKTNGGNEWELLQIKNRDNSENSSSSSIRDVVKQNSGIVIKKWFRTKSRTGKTNWDNFPDEDLKDILNESSFEDHVRKYLKSLKSKA